MSKISCNVIQDLLPLYNDDVCSEESKVMVEEHIKECDACKSILKDIKREVKLPIKDNQDTDKGADVLKAISKNLKRLQHKAFFKGIVVAGVIIAIYLLGYLILAEWNIVDATTEDFEVEFVYQLEEGDIVCRLIGTNGYKFDSDYNFTNDNKEVYITLKKSILKPIKTESDFLQTFLYTYTNVGMTSTFEYNSSNDTVSVGILQVRDKIKKEQLRKEFGTSVEVEKIYFGTQEDNILIWEKGMELPIKSKDELRDYPLYDEM